MKNVIRVGDTNSHGGVVETGASNFCVDGRPVARVGDRCTCPVNGHHDCKIAEGNSDFIVEGRAVAFDGHTTAARRCNRALRILAETDLAAAKRPPLEQESGSMKSGPVPATHRLQRPNL